MKFALAQFNPIIGDCAGNTNKIQQLIEKAAASGASLVVFPELSITGYPPQDLLDTPAFAEQCDSCLERLATFSKQIVAVVGFVEKNPRPYGKPFYNSAAVLRDGKVASVYRKKLLPSYDVFDDERYFEPGKDVVTFDLEGKRFALSICEDVWNFPGFLPRQYPEQPLDAVRKEKPDWLINLSASPFHLGKPALRDELFKNVVSKTGAGLLFCNQVGANDDLIFDGGSVALSSVGETLARSPFFEESLLVFDSTGPTVTSPPAKSDSEWLEEALVLGIRDYVVKSGAKKVCLGLSGGIDSSVVAALAVKALGNDAVKGVLLPSRYTASASNEDALALAAALKIQTVTLPIETLLKNTISVVEQGAGEALKGLPLENAQPRLRMLLLMAVANTENRLLLNTSNKSEIAAGYATIYGDAIGAIGVIADLTKDQVYELAKHINRDGEVIPCRVLSRAPSAELREEQKDEDSLPPYSVLDPMVRDAIERHSDAKELKAKKYPAEHVTNFIRRYSWSEYKRKQYPPALRVSPHAFGRGRRIPVTSVKPW